MPPFGRLSHSSPSFFKCDIKVGDSDLEGLPQSWDAIFHNLPSTQWFSSTELQGDSSVPLLVLHLLTLSSSPPSPHGLPVKPWVSYFISKSQFPSICEMQIIMVCSIHYRILFSKCLQDRTSWKSSPPQLTISKCSMNTNGTKWKGTKELDEAKKERKRLA